MCEQIADQTFDRALLRSRLSAALKSPDFPDFLHRRAAQDIIERLDLILREFETAVVIADKPDDLTKQLEVTGRFKHIVTARTARAH